MALFNLKNIYDQTRFRQRANELIERGECVELKVKHQARTLNQNSYLHVLLGYFACEFGYSLEQVKMELFKLECNRDLFVVTRTNKRGQEIEYVRSSSELTTDEMTTAIERFRYYSSSVCGLYLPEPTANEALFYAQQQIEKNKEYL